MPGLLPFWRIGAGAAFFAQRSNDCSCPRQGDPTEAGITICLPVHDAVLIEAPLELLDEHVAEMEAIMRRASEIVLAGFALRTESKLVRYPDRYMDERGAPMWKSVMGLLELAT